jgi:hypothetical protein
MISVHLTPKTPRLHAWCCCAVLPQQTHTHTRKKSPRARRHRCSFGSSLLTHSTSRPSRPQAIARSPFAASEREASRRRLRLPLGLGGLRAATKSQPHTTRPGSSSTTPRNRGMCGGVWWAGVDLELLASIQPPPLSSSSPETNRHTHTYQHQPASHASLLLAVAPSPLARRRCGRH